MLEELVFSFDADDTWCPLPHSPRSMPKAAPPPTPDQSPRKCEDRRKRASSVYEYFGRISRINAETGSVTWIRIDADADRHMND